VDKDVVPVTKTMAMDAAENPWPFHLHVKEKEKKNYVGSETTPYIN